MVEKRLLVIGGIMAASGFVTTAVVGLGLSAIGIGGFTGSLLGFAASIPVFLKAIKVADQQTRGGYFGTEAFVTAALGWFLGSSFSPHIHINHQQRFSYTPPPAPAIRQMAVVQQPTKLETSLVHPTGNYNGR